MHFRDREEAGKKLAALIGKKYKQKNCVVCGLPRGGMITAREVAKKNHSPLSFVLVKKIGHQMDPEYAIAALSENGHLIEDTQEINNVSQTWLAREIAKQEKEIQKKRELYGPSQQISGKVVIIVDDGIATGLTIRAAIADVQDKHPKKIIVASPVIHRDVYTLLQKITNNVIALSVPEEFLGSVSAYYEFFPQVTDEDVMQLLQKKV